jgi:hypothetical protein
MPSTILLPRNALNLYKTYRDYLGRIYIEASNREQTIDLASDINGRFFRKAIDCPETRMLLINFWNDVIL